MTGSTAGCDERAGRRRLAGSLASLLALQIASAALPLVTMPLLGRALGTPGLGAFALSVSLAQIGYVITDWGFSISATDRIARQRDDADAANRIASEVLCCKLGLLMLLALPTAVLAATQAGAGEAGLTLLTWLLTAALTLQPGWLLQAWGHLASFALAVFLGRVGFVMAVVALARDPGDLSHLLSVNVLTQAMAAAFGWWLAHHHGFRLRQVSLAACRGALAGSWWFMLSRAAAASYTSAATALLAIGGAGSAALGQYAAAEQLYRGLQGLVQPASQALLPFMSGRRELVLFRRIFWLILGATLVVAATCVIVSEPLVALIYGKTFSQSAVMLQMFMLPFIFYVPGVLLGYPFLAAFDKVALANRSVLFAGVAQVVIVTSLFAVARLTPTTLIASILVAELLVLVSRLRWAWMLTGRSLKAPAKGEQRAVGSPT